MEKKYEPFVQDLIELAIAEDIGDGDHPSLSTIPADQRGLMNLLVKQDGIIAGVEID
ncbi:MAG: nicotinate-nucleotide diphosphorylase (carboxylating), partial [Rikenellaceae bacterium]|nr:nicotinate-nucleotide diphosphorylase (carboxylating) [Rikenellaceae bacterium]